MFRKSMFLVISAFVVMFCAVSGMAQEIVWTDFDTDQFDLTHRQGHTMAYDSARKKVVLFGGLKVGSTTEFYGDTWEWDCASKSWTKMNPHNSPKARAYHAMIYNPVRKSVMLQGGRQTYDPSDPEDYSPSTWEWKGGNWQLLSTAGPAKRERHKMVWDAARKQVVLYGGFRYPSVNDETWIWENSGWTLKNPAFKPRERFGHAMSYDSKRKKVVMHSGSHDLDEHTISRSTFEWDGNNWKSVATGGPGYRVYADMVYDVNRGVSVLFGGSYVVNAYTDEKEYYNDTWEWNGINWKKRTFTSFTPNKRSKHAMVYDSKNKVILLWDGYMKGYFDYYMLYLGEKVTEGAADLTIVRAVANPKHEIVAGEKGKFVTTVKNIGNLQAGKFQIRYYLSLDAELDGLDMLIFQKLIHTKLNPGRRLRYVKRRKIKTSVAEDEYYVIAEIVPLGDDAVESNNVKILSNRLSVWQ